MLPFKKRKIIDSDTIDIFDKIRSRAVCQLKLMYTFKSAFFTDNADMVFAESLIHHVRPNSSKSTGFVLSTANIDFKTKIYNRILPAKYEIFLLEDKQEDFNANMKKYEHYIVETNIENIQYNLYISLKKQTIINTLVNKPMNKTFTNTVSNNILMQLLRSTNMEYIQFNRSVGIDVYKYINCILVFYKFLSFANNQILCECIIRGDEMNNILNYNEIYSDKIKKLVGENIYDHFCKTFGIDLTKEINRDCIKKNIINYYNTDTNLIAKYKIIFALFGKLSDYYFLVNIFTDFLMKCISDNNFDKIKNLHETIKIKDKFAYVKIFSDILLS